MNKWENLKGVFGLFKNVLGLVIIALFIVSIATAKINKKTHQLIKEKLADQIRQDLVNKAFAVKLQNVKEYKVSADKVNLIGDAFCIMSDDKSLLPLHFEALVNTSTNKIVYIDYEIIKESKSEVLMSDQEMIAKAVMEKLHQDHDTTNIVLTVDTLEESNELEDLKGVTGHGEVKIDDFTIRRIKFDVKMNVETKKVEVKSYKLKTY